MGWDALFDRVQNDAPQVDKAVVMMAVANTDDDLNIALGASIAKVHREIVGESLATKMCPVVLQSGEWVLLTLPEYEKSDFIGVTLLACKSAGAGEKPIKVLAVSQYMLLHVTQNDDREQNSAQSSEERSGHFATFKDIVAFGVKNDASDVTLSVSNKLPESQVHFTIKGIYTAPQQWRMETGRLLEVLNVAWQSGKGGNSSVLIPEQEQQCRIEMTVGNTKIMCRWASMAADSGVSVTNRLLKTDQKVETRTLEEQGFLLSQREMFRRAQLSEGGAILVAGVVNSGKSTCIAELLRGLPATRKIITLEDPVEYLIPNALQNTIVRSLEGNDDDAFTGKLKTIKRSAPNDLLLGEIRDTVTGDAFVDMNGSGTNIYASIHAGSAMQIPERMASKLIGIPTDLLASPGVLKLLVYQALIPKLCPNCALPVDALFHGTALDAWGVRQEADHWKRYADRISDLYDLGTQTVKVRNPEGCKHCRNEELAQLNGYIDREVVAEMIEPNADRQILRFIKDHDSLGLQEHLEALPRAAIDSPDMTNKSLMECAMHKVFNGLFDPRDVEPRTMSFETVELMRKRSVSAK